MRGWSRRFGGGDGEGVVAEAGDEVEFAAHRTGTGWGVGGRPPTTRPPRRGWGRRVARPEPDPHTGPVGEWMFARRLAGHSLARIPRAVNDAGIPCPSATDPKRNPPRSGQAWTLGTVAAILASPPLHQPPSVE